MADIKTREVLRGSIKTLNRAAIASHHIKEASVRVREYELNTNDDNDSSRGTDLMAGDAGAAAIYAARSGTEHFVSSRDKVAGYDGWNTEFTEDVTADTIGVPGRPSDLPDGEVLRQKATREHAVADITGRKKKARMAEEEALRSGERITASCQAGETAEKSAGVMKKGAGVVTVPSASGNTELVHQRGKDHAIKRITGRVADNDAFGWLERNVSGIRQRRKARRAGRSLKEAVESSKNLLKTLSGGGAFAVAIIVIMVIFGAALNMNEDGNYMVGTGDNAIVEVAKAQLGNVGGDKYWKWYGFSSHVDWCAIFCSWCADQCGYLDAGILPKFAVVGDGASWFKARHRWAGRGYSPKPGDFIFFDFERDGVLDHVGIVEGCDGRIVTTIEGNAGNACKRLTYVAGNSQIAGYGLMIRPAGNNARLIAVKAMQLAYPDAPDEAKYHGGKPTTAYAEALKRAYPNRSGWGQPSKDGASCDVFVGTCIVDSGVDKGFPRGYRDQAIRLAKRTDLYECVVSTSSRDIKESELKDGDICTWEKSSGTVHIWIYAGGKARQASHDKWYPRTTSAGNNLKIRGKTVIRVYRVKD